MTKYEDLIKQRKKKSISLETIFRKYKMSVNDVKNMQEEIEKAKKEADKLMINKIIKYVVRGHSRGLLSFVLIL